MAIKAHLKRKLRPEFPKLMVSKNNIVYLMLKPSVGIELSWKGTIKNIHYDEDIQMSILTDYYGEITLRNSDGDQNDCR